MLNGISETSNDILQSFNLQKAIDDGVIEMDETKSAFQAYDEAWEN